MGKNACAQSGRPFSLNVMTRSNSRSACSCGLILLMSGAGPEAQFASAGSPPANGAPAAPAGPASTPGFAPAPDWSTADASGAARCQFWPASKAISAIERPGHGNGPGARPTRPGSSLGRRSRSARWQPAPATEIWPPASIRYGTPSSSLAAEVGRHIPCRTNPDAWAWHAGHSCVGWVEGDEGSDGAGDVIREKYTEKKG